MISTRHGMSALHNVGRNIQRIVQFLLCFFGMLRHFRFIDFAQLLVLIVELIKMLHLRFFDFQQLLGQSSILVLVLIQLFHCVVVCFAELHRFIVQKIQIRFQTFVVFFEFLMLVAQCVMFDGNFIDRTRLLQYQFLVLDRLFLESEQRFLVFFFQSIHIHQLLTQRLILTLQRRHLIMLLGTATFLVVIASSILVGHIRDRVRCLVPVVGLHLQHCLVEIVHSFAEICILRQE
mmetsp:Transcript_23218/g.37193  ORF Transcript_23218/g.37193 Transcript_23218/m.37193 type:complete len:234 (+) Transcript_23218:498-1199(+)